MTAPACYTTIISPCVGAQPQEPITFSPIPYVPGAPRRTEGSHPPCTHQHHHSSTTPGAAPGTTILQTSPPGSSGTTCARDKETQLGHDGCRLWKLSAIAGGSSPPNPAVFSFHISCFPFFGVLESSVRPCSLPCEQEGGGGYRLLTRHGICSHQPQPLASSLSLQATLTLVPPLCSHKRSHALVKLPSYEFRLRSCLHTSLGQARSIYLAFPLFP